MEEKTIELKNYKELYEKTLIDYYSLKEKYNALINLLVKLDKLENKEL